jgi:hypothetical protein
MLKTTKVALESSVFGKDSESFHTNERKSYIQYCFTHGVLVLEVQLKCAQEAGDRSDIRKQNTCF